MVCAENGSRKRSLATGVPSEQSSVASLEGMTTSSVYLVKASVMANVLFVISNLGPKRSARIVSGGWVHRGRGDTSWGGTMFLLRTWQLRQR